MVNATTGAGAATNSAADTSSTTKKTGALGQDAFLQLLVTQLQHQDPTKPQADGEFLMQLATCSSLEKLTEIADTLGALVTSGNPTT